jgi:site-specific recombinase XerD
MTVVRGGDRKKWLGGYIRKGKAGPTYVIERWISGVHFHVSTRCRTERAALKALERFEADPHGFAALVVPDDAVTISAELVEAFRAACTKRGNTAEWVRQKANYLAQWAEDLGGRDLRNLSVARDLVSALDERETCRRGRIEAIKDFCAYLRERELLKLGDDATVALKVPQATPAKHRRRRVVAEEHVRLVLEHGQLPEATRDVLELQTGTGWHISEVRRFAQNGEIVRPVGGKPLAVLVTRHKSGDLTRTPISTPEHLAAAERLRKRGRIPIPETVSLNMKAACERIRQEQRDAGVAEKDLMPHWRLGSMRHTVLTWAVQHGATPAEAAEFANHRSITTTKRFYLDLAVPTVSVPVLRLVRPEDPKSDAS